VVTGNSGNNLEPRRSALEQIQQQTISSDYVGLATGLGARLSFLNAQNQAILTLTEP
jgi:hypothetical protein